MTPGAGRRAGNGHPPAEWQRVETLGLVDIAMTILEARQQAPLATAATVERAKCGHDVHIEVSLLGGSPGDPAAREQDGAGESATVVASFFVRRLSPDLADAFGDKDVIILK